MVNKVSLCKWLWSIWRKVVVSKYSMQDGGILWKLGVLMAMGWVYGKG